jgi:excisionase family DNA binding protein
MGGAVSPAEPPKSALGTPKWRRPNPRLIKIHRSYSIDEAARLLRAHKNTVRTWIKQGLPIIDRRRPTLIHGADLSAFLKNRRNRAKQPCPPGYMYCFKCRSPQKPAARMADYLPITPTSGNLRGLCPHCGTLMHRRASFAKLNIIGAELDISFPQAVSRIIALAPARGSQREVVVFFHGLGSDALKTWTSAGDVLEVWPKWLAEDIEGLAIWLVRYEAPVSRWRGTAMHLIDRASNVLHLILAKPRVPISRPW